MASAKDEMMDRAGGFIGVVSKAKCSCDSAAQEMQTSITMVSQSWQGTSGFAVEQALCDLRARIVSIASRLSNLQTQMSAHAKSSYDNWPEEKVVSDPCD